MANARVTNHYELLGVSPAASDAEISQAFARKMSLFGAHLMAEAPQISIAYDTLRNPVKRRDYDRSLGLHVRSEPHAWGFTVAPPRWMPLVAPLGSSAVTPEPHVELEPTPVNPRAAAMAASLREVASPVRPKPVEQRQHGAGPDPTEPLIQHILEVGREEREGLYEERERSFDWKKPAMAAGGLLVGAGVIGAAAGLSVKDNAAAAKPEPVVSVALPAARVAADAAAPAAEAEPLFTPSARAAPPRARHSAAPQRPSAFADDIAQSLSADATAGETAPLQPAEGVQAGLPLSSPVIARTIERIGYKCGEVSATAPAGSGAFTVTCTSGGTYQAKPVRGRFRFRRVAG